MKREMIRKRVSIAIWFQSIFNNFKCFQHHQNWILRTKFCWRKKANGKHNLLFSRRFKESDINQNEIKTKKNKKNDDTNRRMKWEWRREKFSFHSCWCIFNASKRITVFGSVEFSGGVATSLEMPFTLRALAALDPNFSLVVFSVAVDVFHADFHLELSKYISFFSCLFSFTLWHDFYCHCIRNCLFVTSKQISFDSTFARMKFVIRLRRSSRTNARRTHLPPTGQNYFSVTNNERESKLNSAFFVWIRIKVKMFVSPSMRRRKQLISVCLNIWQKRWKRFRLNAFFDIFICSRFDRESFSDEKTKQNIIPFIIHLAKRPIYTRTTANANLTTTSDSGVDSSDAVCVWQCVCNRPNGN